MNGSISNFPIFNFHWPRQLGGSVVRTRVPSWQVALSPPLLVWLTWHFSFTSVPCWTSRAGSETTLIHAESRVWQATVKVAFKSSQWNVALTFWFHISHSTNHPQIGQILKNRFILINLQVTLCLLLEPLQMAMSLFKNGLDVHRNVISFTRVKICQSSDQPV